MSIDGAMKSVVRSVYSADKRELLRLRRSERKYFETKAHVTVLALSRIGNLTRSY